MRKNSGSGNVRSISGSEWLVADVLWTQDGLAATEVTARLTGTAWKQKTVNTFLTRLVEKGVLAVKREGRANRYFVNVPREQCVRAEAESFVRRVFRGAAAPLLAHFCETASLTDQEIAELRGILDRRLDAKKPKTRTK